MKETPVLSALTRIEQLIDQQAPSETSIHEFWIRDKRFLKAVRTSLEQNEAAGAQWSLEQMRNLSQGFGGYVHDLEKLDEMLDVLHSALQQVILSHRR